MSKFPERIIARPTVVTNFRDLIVGDWVPDLGQEPSVRSTRYVRADLYDALRPVPVDQVPEAWKDGRKVILWIDGHDQPEIGWWETGWWMVDDEVLAEEIGKVEYVSLPLPPQEPANA